MTRTIWASVLALVLVNSTSPARADIGPGPSPSVNRNMPAAETPRRNGPFRSCGSGAGTGLAAIGASWAVLWLGTRVAGRVRGTKD